MSASVDRRGSLRWGDFSRIRIALPALAEQNRISATLKLIDAEIEQLSTLRALNERQKRGYLAQLLSGEMPVQ